VHPDFTIHRPDGSVVLWEHFGLMDDIEYARKWSLKLAWYTANGFPPFPEYGDKGTFIRTDDTGGVKVPDRRKLAAEAIGPVASSSITTNSVTFATSSRHRSWRVISRRPPMPLPSRDDRPCRPPPPDSGGTWHDAPHRAPIPFRPIPETLDHSGLDLCAPAFAPCLLGCPGTVRHRPVSAARRGFWRSDRMTAHGTC
jgi:hypothetical protein